MQQSYIVLAFLEANINTVTKKLWSYIKNKIHENVGSAGLLNLKSSLTLWLRLTSFQAIVFTNEDTSCVTTMEGISLPYVDAI